MKISVLMPVYNEAKTLKEIIRRVKSIDIVGELVIVDDCSTDGSRGILKEEAQENGMQVHYHDINQGKGAAIRTGLSHITGDIVIIQDADLEYDPRDYPKLIKPILNGTADVVYGSRFLKRESIPHCKRIFYLTHFFGNKFLNFVLNILYKTKITDMETCYKAIKRNALNSLELSARGFEIEPEITVSLLRNGFKIYEVPISYVPRDYSEGKKISWRDGASALFVLLKYRFKKMRRR